MDEIDGNFGAKKGKNHFYYRKKVQLTSDKNIPSELTLKYLLSAGICNRIINLKVCLYLKQIFRMCYWAVFATGETCH
jgi:hypothetical protein